MKQSFYLGVSLALLGGVSQGAMLLPMKFMNKWNWENIWLGFVVAAYLLFPWALAVVTVPHLLDVLLASSPKALILTFLFGLGWGVGTLIFGLGINIVGLALGYAIIMGLTASIGTLVPMMVLSPEKLAAQQGLVIMVGVALTIFGTSLCCWAGRLRDAPGNPSAHQGATMPRKPYILGLSLCVGSGMLIPCGNLALAFGSEIAEKARAAGASHLNSANALWAIAMLPLFLCSFLYCLSLLMKNKSFPKFKLGAPARYWGLILLMGLLQVAGIALYGSGATSLGKLGTSIGFSILMSSMILSANLFGAVTGEWKGVGHKPIAIMVTGLMILIGAIFLVGYGNKPEI